MDKTRDAPLFPLNTVLFPGGRLPLRIFEQRYMTMAKNCLKDGTTFGVCLIRSGNEIGTAATPAEVGCLAAIGEWEMPQLGVLNVIAQGEQRFRIIEHRVQKDGLAVATIELLDPEGDAAVPAELSYCAELLRSALRGSNLPATEQRYDSASWISSRLAEILPLPLSIKQDLLELDSGLERLRRVAALLGPKLPSRPES